MEVVHRHRVGRLQPAQDLGTVASCLAVHRAEDGDLRGGAVDTELGGDRRVHVVCRRGPRQGLVPRHSGQDARLDLTEVGADEDVVRLGDDRRAEVGCEAVDTGGGRHPTGRTVRPRPLATEPAVGADMLVEPGIPIRRGGALHTPPGQQRPDDRVGVAELLEPPRPSVGDLDTDPSQQRPHLGRVTQVDRRSGRCMA